MATGGSENTSDEIINIKCSICAAKNITREAQKHCKECQDYYCIPCSDMHSMFPLMRGHTLLDKASFNTSGLKTTLPCFPTEVCSVHKGRLLEMYCRNHDDIVCVTCVALDHRTCEDIHSIPDELDTLYKKSESAEVDRQLTAAKKTMEIIKKSKEDLVIEMKKYKKNATDSIRQFRKEMETILEELEKESLKEVEAEYGKIESKLLNAIKEVENLTDCLEQSTDKLKKSVGNRAQEFVLVKASIKAIRKVKEAETCLREPDGVELVFLNNPQIQTCLQQMETLGQVTRRGTTVKPRTTVYSVKEQNEVCVKRKSEKHDCWILGSCFTENGLLLLADHENDKITLVDLSTNCIKDHLRMPSSPIAVCLISKNEAATTLNSDIIQIISLGNKMSANKRLKLYHDCYGLAYKNNKLFISDGNSAVYIHDKSGTMLHMITSDYSGNPIFKESRHISLSTYGDKVYVADNDKGLITLDTQGHYESTFTDPDVPLIQGVCIDGRGNIFVSGNGSSAIIQISEQSRSKLGVLGKVQNSLSVCFDSFRNKLVETSHKKNSVTVYELM